MVVWEKSKCMTVSSMRMMWHIWPGQYWPFTLEQEQTFYEKLLARAENTNTEFGRDDVTTLLGMLRCGTTLEQATDLAPGLNFCRLVSAYCFIDKALQRSIKAWEAIVERPENGTFCKNQNEAQKILPAVVKKLSAQQEDSTSLQRTVAEAKLYITEANNRAYQLEVECLKLPVPSTAALNLGCQLFHPNTPGIYGDPYYLPNRLSSLSPTRVDALVGGSNKPPAVG